MRQLITSSALMSILTLALLLVWNLVPVRGFPNWPNQRYLGYRPRADSANECPQLPPRDSPPSSVHDLRVDDIRVLAALGDSITAGFGAKGISRTVPPSMNNTLEDRGVAFSMGGDDNATTLFKFFQNYRENVQGASVGSHLAEICVGPLCPPFQYRPGDNFNAAQSGAMISNLHQELDYLIVRMRMDPNVHWWDDFKLITLFMGSNDACLGCEPVSGHTYLSPDAYEAIIRGILEKIRVWDLTHRDSYCKALRNTGLVFECTCAFLPGLQGPWTRLQMDILTQAYNTRLQNIVAAYNTTKSPAFAVVLDPLLSNTAIKEWDIEYLSSVDCFHPALNAHEVLARGVWRNLFRRSWEKDNRISPGGRKSHWCARERDRIATI